ncbi:MULTISPECIES: hypothetical protein [unclassified Mesorhizobium]|uniref:hypothetical protein n=1 Tax=unclassified Mesorhizobium TaxID=325217 RepID=UPI0033377DE7
MANDARQRIRTAFRRLDRRDSQLLDLRQRVANYAEAGRPPGSFLYSGVSAQSRASAPGGVASTSPQGCGAVTSPSQEHTRKLAAARQRRRRRREQRGEIVVPFVAADEFITWAIDTGRVDETRAWDRVALARALRLIVIEAMASRVTDGFAEAAVRRDQHEESPTRRPTDARKALPDREN